MKPLLISTNDLDGGAARAAYRLHQGLRALAVPSRMLVRSRQSVDPTVISQKAAILAKLGPFLDGQVLRLYPHHDHSLFSPQWCPDPIAAKVKALDPDLISLHWICNGYLQIETLAKLHKPIVWTLHDMWPLTGGCHYTQDCERFTKACGTCPHLNSARDWDLSRWLWQRKRKTYRALNLTIVSPSHWLADCARNSSLFSGVRVEVIPHGLNTSVYQPIEQPIARKLLNLPPDKYLLLFGATSGAVGATRKGLHLLQAALQKLSQTNWQDKLELVIFGAEKPLQPLDFGFPAHYLGQLHDDITLALVYSAADVMVVPSLQEAFGQTASESLACGTPVVAFNATGLKDIVTHQQDGYLATPFEVDDLAQGIDWILADRDRYSQLCDNARQKVERELTLELQSQRYRSLFKQVLDKTQQ